MLKKCMDTEMRILLEEFRFRMLQMTNEIKARHVTEILKLNKEQTKSA